MFKHHRRLAASAVGLLCALLVPLDAARAEDYQGTTIESRLLLGFKANDAAVAAWLPHGWTPVTLAKGPLTGTNLILALMDQQLIRDAEGKPKAPPINRVAAFLTYGRKEGVEGVRAFVTRIYEPAPIIDPYGTSVAATITQSSAKSSAASGVITRNEVWNIQPANGGEISLRLSFESGLLGWLEKGETLPYSAANPDFHRIYHYDQLAELVMNAGIGKALSGDVAFSTTVPELAALFDGSEQLVALVSIPVYVRSIFLP